MKKRTVLGLAGIIMAMAVLSGCGDKSGDKAQESAETVTEDTAKAAEDTKETSEENETAEAVDENAAGGAGESAQDAAGLAQRLRNEITYQDDLNEVDLETAGMFLSFGDAGIEEAYIYESSGATAEEIVVVKGSSKEDADKLKSALENRVSEQKEAYEDYVPEELKKLSEAVVVIKDNTAVLSVSDEPDKAKEIIGN